LRRLRRAKKEVLADGFEIFDYIGDILDNKLIINIIINNKDSSRLML